MQKVEVMKLFKTFLMVSEKLEQFEQDKTPPLRLDTERFESMLGTKLRPGETEEAKQELVRRAEKILQTVGGPYYQKSIEQSGRDAERVRRVQENLNEGVTDNRLNDAAELADSYKREFMEGKHPNKEDYVDRIFGKYMQRLIEHNIDAAVRTLALFAQFSEVNFQEVMVAQRETLRSGYISERGQDEGFDEFCQKYIKQYENFKGAF